MMQQYLRFQALAPSVAPHADRLISKNWIFMKTGSEPANREDDRRSRLLVCGKYAEEVGSIPLSAHCSGEMDESRSATRDCVFAGGERHP
jgi:hypothetical protein